MQQEVPNQRDINTRIQQMQQEYEKAMQALRSELREEMQQIVNTSIESSANAIKNDVKDFFKECMETQDTQMAEMASNINFLVRAMSMGQQLTQPGQGSQNNATSSPSADAGAITP
jgi:hypothetical protein